METAEDVRELPIVGGHIALDFANTIDDPAGPARHDHIADYAGLVRWAGRVDIVTAREVAELTAIARAHPRTASAAVRAAHELRTLIGGLFAHAATGHGVDPMGWEGLRPRVAAAVAHARLERGSGSYEYHWPLTERPDALLWPVVYGAAELLTAADLSRVKQCAGCPWLFLDRSKNGSRRWCSMQDCGTHAKIVKYVARRAARRPGAD